MDDASLNKPPEDPEMNLLSQVIDNDHMEKICAEFARLGDKCYLENAGATLYPQCLISSVTDDLTKNFYMNPHSDKYTKNCIEQIRWLILKHFNTDPSNYTVVFTSGCTQSLKLTAESFQFSTDIDDETNCGLFMYLRDNHTSALGLREIAIDKNADIIHISHQDFLSTLQQGNKSHLKNKCNSNSLFVYPAQSNFNGYKYPIDCVEKIKNGCLNKYVKKNLCKINCKWYVLLDAASYVASNKLDLSVTQPDFVTLSFYKIFGFPTGLGALLVKNESECVLNQKSYFGGGTVDVVLSSEDYHVKREAALYERLEDGTVSFLSIIALKHCFDTMHKLIPKVVHNDIMETISHHTFFLAKDLCYMLSELRHENGRKAAVLYMDSDFTDIRKQSGIVTFNLIRDDGSYIGYAEFQHMADLFDINVRTGCFCNSGACQRHLAVTNKEMKDMFKAGHKCGDEIDLYQGRPTGAVRVSFGYFNTFRDVDKLINMICRCFVKTKIKKQKRMKLSYNGLDSVKVKSKIQKGDIIISNPYYPSSLSSNISYQLKSEDIQLKEIAIFPIKSCAAFKIRSAWKIGPKGFEYDREWMIVRDVGVCLTQKQNPRMCLIQPKVDIKQKLLILHFKGKSSISIPLEPAASWKETDSNMCRSRVCSDTVKGYDCGDEVADWLSEALEMSFLRLIRQSVNDGRMQKKKNSIDKPMLSLSNQAQFLLINKATVRWLKNKIHDPRFTDDVDKLTDRFRGNLIIDMDQELAERDWIKIIIGNHEFKVEGQCPRCQMVCIDQQTGEKTVEPLRTISEQFNGKLRFGMYLNYVGPVDGSNDRVLRTNAHIKAIINDDNLSR